MPRDFIPLLEQHSREDFDIMSVLRPVIPLLAGTCLSSASYNTRELINGLYFWFPQRKGKVRSLYRLMPGLTEFQKASNNCQRLYHESLSGAAVGFWPSHRSFFLLYVWAQGKPVLTCNAQTIERELTDGWIPERELTVCD